MNNTAARKQIESDARAMGFGLDRAENGTVFVKVRQDGQMASIEVHWATFSVSQAFVRVGNRKLAEVSTNDAVARWLVRIS